MIEIKIYNNGFEISGHASFSKKGIDIVCAGVSAISQGLINCFEQKDVNELIIKDGYIKFILNNINKKNKTILDVFKTQIISLANSYEKYIKVKE